MTPHEPDSRRRPRPRRRPRTRTTRTARQSFSPGEIHRAGGGGAASQVGQSSPAEAVAQGSEAARASQVTRRPGLPEAPAHGRPQTSRAHPGRRRRSLRRRRRRVIRGRTPRDVETTGNHAEFGSRAGLHAGKSIRWQPGKWIRRRRSRDHRARVSTGWWLHDS